MYVNMRRKLALALSVSTIVSANYTQELDARSPSFIDPLLMGPRVKRCAGAGCAAYPLDLSTSLPFVRFVLNGTEADGDGPLKGTNRMLTMFNCENDSQLGTDVKGIYFRTDKNLPQMPDYVRQCQSFLLKELPGFGNRQTFAIGVSNPTVPWGWTMWASEEKTVPYFGWLDPLWTPAQRFRLDCKKPRQKGQASDYLAKECQIIATYPTSPEQQLCLRTSDNPPESIEGGIQRGRCDELAESFWNILDVSKEFVEQPTYTYPTSTSEPAATRHVRRSCVLACSGE